MSDGSRLIYVILTGCFDLRNRDSGVRCDLNNMMLNCHMMEGKQLIWSKINEEVNSVDFDD